MYSLSCAAISNLYAGFMYGTLVPDIGWEMWVPHGPYDEFCPHILTAQMK